jgi:hypothetical protein
MAIVMVTNTLPESPGPAGNGIALANVAERLRLLHDVAATLHCGVEHGLLQRPHRGAAVTGPAAPPPLRVLIVDDEPLARLRLRGLVEANACRGRRWWARRPTRRRPRRCWPTRRVTWCCWTS